MKSILFSLSFFFFFTMLISCKKEAPDIDLSYRLHSLSLGVAYPPVRNDAEALASISYLRDLGVKYTHLNEDWRQREASDGLYNWNPLEMRLKAFKDAGISVLLTIESTWPSWLGSSGNHTESETIDAYRRYISTLLSQYALYIDKIQYGNEWHWSIDDYFQGDVDAYILYSNILYEEVMKLPQETRPVVVLGSGSGLYLAADQGLLSQYVVEGVAVYEREVAQYLQLPEEQRFTPFAEKVFNGVKYEMLDIHLYDNYQDWPLMIRAYLNVHEKCKQIPVSIIVSEFGGPYSKDLYPVFGTPSERILAERLVEYVKILDNSPVAEAHFFKLVQGGTPFHPASYLLNSDQKKMKAYSVMRYFGKQ